MLSKVQDREEVGTKLRNIQDSSKLDNSRLMTLYNWLEPNWAYTNCIDEFRVGAADWNIAGSVGGKPVVVRCHMSSGPCISGPVSARNG
jgi:hypothetical protein